MEFDTHEALIDKVSTHSEEKKWVTMAGELELKIRFSLQWKAVKSIFVLLFISSILQTWDMRVYFKIAKFLVNVKAGVGQLLPQFFKHFNIPFSVTIITSIFTQ